MSLFRRISQDCVFTLEFRTKIHDQMWCHTLCCQLSKFVSVMSYPPADGCCISRLAVPLFCFSCIFGGFGDFSLCPAALVHVTLSHFMSFSTISRLNKPFCHLAWNVSCIAKQFLVELYHIKIILDRLLCCAIWHQVELFHAMLCHLMLWSTILHYIQLFHASLIHFMLCCTIRDYNVLFEHREVVHSRFDCSTVHCKWRASYSHFDSTF